MSRPLSRRLPWTDFTSFGKVARTPKQPFVPRLPFSYFKTMRPYSAVIAGAGPAGLAVVGNLLESNPKQKILWVDPDLQGGNLNKEWREVPSNTNAKLFADFATALEPFREIVEAAPKPNAFTKITELVPNKGCSISYAADLCVMLTDHLKKMPEVDTAVGKVRGANWDSLTSTWTAEVATVDQPDLVSTFSSKRLILCTGSTPASLPVPVPGLNIIKTPLSVALQPSRLSPFLPKDAKVAVIGASHSAILVLLNLLNLASTTHPDLKVVWFTRNSLRYAEYKEGWILRDNTGLKGLAAEFARTELEEERLPGSKAGRFITKIDCSGGHEQEQKCYESQLPGCSHIITATGFTVNPKPLLSRDGKVIAESGLTYNNLTGGFNDADGKETKGLFGAGIAYPERVTDPYGNQELNVGMWKFMKFLRRVVPEWLERENLN